MTDEGTKTRKIANTAIGRDVAEGLAGFGLKVFTTFVSQRVIFAESAATGRVAREVDPAHPGSREIENLTNEILELAA